MGLRKKVVGCILCLVLIAIAVVKLIPRSTGLRGTVAFVGWTNIAGLRNAVFRFPPATVTKPKRNFLFYDYYRIRLTFVTTWPNGQTNLGFFEIGGAYSANSTTELTVPIRVSTNGASVQVATAESWLERHWDNVRLPFSLSTNHYTFVPPELPLEEIQTQVDEPKLE